MPVSGTPKEIIEQEMHRFKHGQLHSGPDKYGHLVKDRKQAVAIALSQARRHGRNYGGSNFGGPAPWYVRNEARSMTHVGPIHGMIPGRTDHVPMSVPNGSYVLPADHVSHFGQGNTQAGFARLNHVFKATAIHAGHGLPRAPAVPHPAVTASGLPKGIASVLASGGIVGPDDQDGVDIMAASGEYVIHPDDVREWGGGNLRHGHQILDEWVKGTRDKHIKTLKKLPGPAK